MTLFFIVYRHSSTLILSSETLVNR